MSQQRIKTRLKALRSYITKPLLKIVNRYLTNRYNKKTLPRPSSYSLKSDKGHLTWGSITNKSFFARHAAPDPELQTKLPKIDDVLPLFLRETDDFKPGRSNLLFMFLAQWFTDGFFRSNHYDPKKTDSNHEIDLCQIYGINDDVTSILRSKKQGKLRSTIVNGEEYPPLLYKKNKQGKYVVDDCFKKLPYCTENHKDFKKLSRIEGILLSQYNLSTGSKETKLPDNVKKRTFATGLDRGSTTIGHRLLNTLFLREHNRICDELIASREFDESDNDALFETARIVNIIVLLRIVTEHYINHIADTNILRLDLDKPKLISKKLSWFEKKHWYREPWVAAEFNLLYRWHGLVPNSFKVKNKNIDFLELAGHFENLGVDQLLQAAVAEPAGKIQLGNTPPFLIGPEKETIKKGREWKLPSYNTYRKKFGLKPISDFSQLSSNKVTVQKLKKQYKDIDNLEFTVGIFAEEPKGDKLGGELMTAMVAYDAFTQIYPNPLIANKNYHSLLPKSAKAIVEKTNHLHEFINRNTNLSARKLSFSAMAHAKPVLKVNLPKINSDDIYYKILCPNLRIGVRLGLLKPNKQGWVTRKELTQFLQRIGVEEKTFISKKLVATAAKITKIKKPGYVNIAGFEGTSFDHGSSTSILNNAEGFSEDRLNKILAFNNNDRFYISEFRDIAKFCHNKPYNKKKIAKKSGEVFQLLEFEILIKIYGRVDENEERYLTTQDLIDIWQNGQPRDGWNYPDSSMASMPWAFKSLFSSIFNVFRRNLTS